MKGSSSRPLLLGVLLLVHAALSSCEPPDDQASSPGVLRVVQDLVRPPGSRVVATEDLSNRRQAIRHRWHIRISGTWAEYRELVSRRLEENEFQVEATTAGLTGRKLTSGDSYVLEIRPLPHDPEDHTEHVDAEFLATPF